MSSQVRISPLAGALSLAFDGHEERSLVEWAGGRPARTRMTRLLYETALASYLEWSSRAGDTPARRWDWGPAGPPAEEPAQTGAGDDTEEVTLPGPDETVSFEAHIKPLFREHDRTSMSFAFDLWSQADVQEHAAAILERLRDGTMPCDGGWPADQIEVFRRWTESGFQP